MKGAVILVLVCAVLVCITEAKKKRNEKNEKKEAVVVDYGRGSKY